MIQMRFCSLTLGCKVNQFETQGIESILVSLGHTQAKPGDGCDVCIVNTCAVTAQSARKSRQAVRRMRNAEPDALVAVCGCLTQLEPQTALSLGADLVGGSGDRRGFALEIEQLYNEKRADGSFAWRKQEDGSLAFLGDSGKQGDGLLAFSGGDEEMSPDFREPSLRFSEMSQRFRESSISMVADARAERQAFEELPPGVAAGRTRALVKIQDGCDNRCAYCVIPNARGRSRSLPAERAAGQARSLGEQGFREIVVTGIEISSYGKDLPGNPTLTDAMRTISLAAPGARLRLGSLDPGAVTEGFCRELGAISNLCDHFHLSLQSGCDATLRRMGRKYGTDAVSGAVSSLRRLFPDCGITADLIVGFPGETDAEFGQTLEFIKAAAFSGMHIFPFSARPGTRAADMPGQLDKCVKRERAGIAAATAQAMSHRFRLSQVGKTVTVLFERRRCGFWAGHSGNYIEVCAEGAEGKNSMHEVRLAAVEGGFVFGEIID